MRAHVVLGLAFGDCGKGLLTDHLVRRTGADVVVRFNGGAQAGHNVLAPDGRHHTFSQFGAGTFAGARTFLSSHVVVHPTALLVEGRLLEGKGVPDALARIGVSERARIITPFHQALNRLREMARGAARHGSCGVGVGETVKHALEWPGEAVLAGDLRDRGVLRGKLDRIRERLCAEVRALAPALRRSPAVEAERATFAGEAEVEPWIDAARELPARGIVVPDAALGRWLEGAADVVFEGAQGVLLDADRGFHPHTPWSRCTFANVPEVLADCALDAKLIRVGVLRSHAVRHGDGPLPTETGALRGMIPDHNQSNEWQGDPRFGWFDAVLARHALDLVGGVDLLAITHLDLLARIERPAICTAYDRDPRDAAHGGARIERLPVEEVTTLERQEELGLMLRRVTPVLEEAGSEERFLARVEELIGRPVDLVSRGPQACHVAPARADVPEVRAAFLTPASRLQPRSRVSPINSGD